MADASPEFRRLSEDSVRRRTGKGWAQWMSLLDEWGAARKGQAETTAHLSDAHGVSPWWARAVAIRYEYERGLRQAK